MATQRRAARPVRHSVTIPANIASEVRRVANERHVTISRALVVLAERGLQAEAEAKRQLAASHSRFLGASDPAEKEAAGKELIRSIFGVDAIAEDPVR